MSRPILGAGMTTLELIQKTNDLNILLNDLLSLNRDELMKLLDNPNIQIHHGLQYLIERELEWA